MLIEPRENGRDGITEEGKLKGFHVVEAGGLLT
jgi:hypothetical protein